MKTKDGDQIKSNDSEWATDVDPRNIRSKWSINSAVGNLPNNINKRVAKYHASRGRKKV